MEESHIKKLPIVEIERVKLSQFKSRNLQDYYTKIAQVGSGTYGNVFKACSLSDPSKLFALKQLNTSKETEGFPITAMREMKIMQKLDHDNILKIREVVTDTQYNAYNNKYSPSSETYIVLDYMEHDFQGLLRQKVKYSESEIKCLIKQLLLGMDHLHKNNIIHRDLKSANILLSKQGVLKIADFGFARSIEKPFTRPLTPIVVTLWYRAPEILLGHGTYNEKSDVWSIGCFMIELFLMESLFKGQSEKSQVDVIFQFCGTPTEEHWPGVTRMRNYDELKPDQDYHTTFKESISQKIQNISPQGLEFINKLMTLNPDKRYSTEEALKDPYFEADPKPCQHNEIPQIEKECHEQLIQRESISQKRRELNQQDHMPSNRRTGQKSFHNNYNNNNSVHHIHNSFQKHSYSQKPGQYHSNNQSIRRRQGENYHEPEIQKRQKSQF